jgi:FkbM family methyltransferase
MTPPPDSMKTRLKAVSEAARQRRPVRLVAAAVRRIIFGSIRTVAFDLDGTQVRFHTDDRHSRSWFLPRYAEGRLHEPVVSRMILDSLEMDGCFVDVGAHVGWFTCLAACRASTVRVLALEMDGLSADLLERNVALNGCTNVQVHRVAAWDVPGSATFQRRHRQPSPTLRLGGQERPGGEDVHVQMVALDELFAATAVRPDMIKIDVEGAEVKVLRGLAGTLAAVGPELFVEAHPRELEQSGSSVPELLGLLIDQGYTVHEVTNARQEGRGPELRRLGRGSHLSGNCMLWARRSDGGSPRR